MNCVGVMGLPGGSEVILIIFVILLLFGAKKLPELSRSLGKSLGEFKKGQHEGELPDEAIKQFEDESDTTAIAEEHLDDTDKSE
ncbi:MAG: twin-arginine translocase TatA/TatE family subunit [Kiritimatiellaceae bacterium]|nr:twin-arginine translocase TatA/TatE family subunit [Kiritimatiellaceae bacterium]